MAKNSAQSNRPICVLGMHRSGTSCLAGSLEFAGVHLGNVVNKSPHNAKGNKENKALRQINEDLLAFNGGSWDRLPGQLRWNSNLKARRDTHLAGFKGIPLWGFKDPRCLATLPFWSDALGEMHLVATVRHPATVAQSLSSRPGLAPRTEPLQLWIDYNQRLLRLCRSDTVHLVCFDWPEAVYLDALKRLSSILGLPEASGKTQFFESGLRGADPVWPSVPHRRKAQAEELYQALRSRALVDQDVH